jgi:cyclase
MVACALITCIFLIGAARGFADSVTTQERSVTKLADGVYDIRHPDAPDGNVNGNTTVIIGSRTVFVVDSCFVLSEARRDIEQIRRWTDKPVRYLLNTHWHNDHNMGNGLYAAAFPAMDIIAHSETKANMYRTPTTPGRFVKYVEQRKQQLASGHDAGGKPLTDAQIKHLRKSLAGKIQLLEELQTFVPQMPTATFDNRLDIDLGGRAVQVLFLGRGTTPGDAVVYLPKEKIVVAGDLLTHPVLFTYDGYPAEWARTLERLGQLDVEIIVPGHGDVLHDKKFLYLCRDFLDAAATQVHDRLSDLSSSSENPPLEDVRKGVDLSRFRPEFAGNDQEAGQQFDDAAAALVKVLYQREQLK